MLMKQLWRVLNSPDLLINKILKQKYFQNEDLLEVKPMPRDSFVWKSIAGVINVFKHGLVLINGNEWKWKHSDTAEYSIKSGYELARRWILASQHDQGEGSDWVQARQIWSRLWKIRTSDRVKLVVWRLFHNSLPVFANLRKRGCDTGQGCALCGYMTEDTDHLFFNCWWTKGFWDSLGVMDEN